VTEVCTIATRAQLASARVLAEDVRKHHDTRLHVLVIDDHDAAIGGAEEPFAQFPASELGLAQHDLLRLAMLFEPHDLITAVTPVLLCALLGDGALDVVFLGAQMAVYAPLDDVASRAREHGAALARRRDRPFPADGRVPDEPALLDAGLFDPRLVAVGPKARELLDDWTRTVAALDPGDRPETATLRARGWIDHLLARGAVHVLEDPTVGVSRWNLDERALEIRDGRTVVAGQALRSFDFSDVDPRAAHLLAPVADGEHPRTVEREAPALAALRNEYVDRLRQAERTTDATATPFEHLTDGTPIDTRMRALYREAVTSATGPDSEPPNPLAPGGTDAFVAWLREPTVPDVAPRVGRYLARYWDDSPLLRDEYPELDPATADMFETWCRAHADLPACVLPTEAENVQRRAERRRARPQGPRPVGVNIVGYLGAVLGLGEVARNLAEALEGAGVPVAAVTNPATASRELYAFDCVAPDAAPYDLNLFVVTADMLPPLAGRLGPDFFAGRRSIGLWFWEAERFRPGALAPAIPLLDEVWAPSAFVRDAVDAAVQERPVETVPIPVPVPAPPTGIDRSALGLPDDRFVFLFMFDYFSVTTRKNPLGLIDAYTRAFAPTDGAMLVLKSINGADRFADLEAVRVAAAERPDILVWDEYLTPDRRAALLGCCDAYVSLHRAEGLGLTMAEAMALGKPVVATGYSGNLEFMTDDTAFLVRSALTAIGTGVDPYPADARWADPDLEHAAALMRQIFDDRAHAAQVGRRAAEVIASRWSSTMAGSALARFVDQARSRPRDPDGPWRRFFMRGWRNRLLGPIPRRYQFDWLADGFPFDASVHRIFSYSLQRSLARGGRRTPTDPDGPDATQQMVQWLNAPIAPRRRPIVPRYLVQYWHDHPELQQQFPAIESDRVQAATYVQWVAEHWHAETDIDYRLVPGR